MADVISLAKYNHHKRRTLDRISGKFSRQMLRYQKDFFDSILFDFKSALDRGDKSFSIRIDLKTERAFENIFIQHKKESVFVAIADGMQEVPIDETKKLNAWADFPLAMPIERTLTSLEQKEAKTLADQIEEKMGAKKPRFFAELLRMRKKDILKQIKKAYTFASQDWIAGKSTIVEVKEKLSQSLLRSKSGIDKVFRTETTRYFNETRVEYFDRAKLVTHFQIFAITDGRISDICNSRHGYVLKKNKANLKKYLPPFHVNCRTIQRPLMEKISRHKKLIDKGLKMDERRFTPLPRGWAA